MADKITQTKELKIVAGFVDEDTRTLTLDGPKDDLTAAQVNAVGALMKTYNFLIGDKAGAAFYGLNSAKIVKKRVTQLDLR